MAGFRARIQLCLLAVTFWSTTSIIFLARSGDGAQIVVGDEYGWHYQPMPDNSSSQLNYQGWADAGIYFVNDSLDFGIFTGFKKDPSKAVMHVSSELVENCNTSTGILLTNVTTGLPTIFYLQTPGDHGFISPFSNYCTFGMKFTVNVVHGLPSQFQPVAVPEALQALSNDPSPSPQPSQSSQPSGSSQAAQPVTAGNLRGKKAIVGAAVEVGLGAAVVVALISMVIMKRKFILRKFCGRQHFVDVSSSKPSSWKSTSSSKKSDKNHKFNSPHTVKDIKAAAADIKSTPPPGPQRYSYKELDMATKNFEWSLVIGQGGFGTVYKGYLKDSSKATVAVKRLRTHAWQGAKEFTSEINIISQLRHRNLVPLLGWCDENEELILVYDYMPNGDLDDLIFGCVGDETVKHCPLSWKYRYNSFCGVATALVYLHEEWEQRVVHRDVKTSNVMLDSEFNARLGDFGLARLSAHSQVPRTTLVAGTIGYLAPELSLSGRATDKADVYAFGVVVLEVSCARRPLTSNCILVDWVWELHEEEKLLDAIDPKLDVRRKSDEEEMARALQVGLLCCHPDPAARPTMRDALNILTCKTPLPKLPRSKPVAVFPDDKFEFSILSSAVAFQGKQEDVQFDELHNKNLRDQSAQTVCTVTIVT
ncbi:unnamed protein product [Calypogeia fissa]